MKLSTANFSMPRMIKTIISMLIITTVVLSLVQGSITVKAAEYELPYIICVNGTSVYVSDGPFMVLSDESNTTDPFGPTVYLASVNCTSCLKLEYSTSLNQWVTDSIRTINETTKLMYRYGTSTQIPQYSNYNTIIPSTSRDPVGYWASKSVITNCSFNTAEQNLLGGYSNDITQLPQGLTESAIQDIIDQQLNTQTASGSTAQTIINNTTNQYNLYLSGDIDSQTMQQNVTSNIDTLSELTPSTLLDAMQINNALTYNQSIQDKLLNTASPTLVSEIASYLRESQTLFNQYRAGTKDQKTVLDRFSNINRFLTRLSYEGGYTSTADIEYINMAINTINNYTDQIVNLKDMDTTVSDKSQQSDQEELDYLDELEAETTATIEQLAPSQNFSGAQTGDAQELMNLVWDNEFVKRLLPMCAGFMVVCVVLGIRYKV